MKGGHSLCSFHKRESFFWLCVGVPGKLPDLAFIWVLQAGDDSSDTNVNDNKPRTLHSSALQMKTIYCTYCADIVFSTDARTFLNGYFFALNHQE